jgi:hypothetical protein
MQSVSFRDLQSIAPLILRKKLTSEGVLVVTVNKKPFAAMISLDDENVQDALLMVSRMRAQIATRAIRGQAHRTGLNGMTLKEVNALIKKTRMEQKRGKSVPQT